MHSSAKGQCFLTKRLNSESNKKARHFKFLRGPICQPFSKMGNQNGINDERYVTHKKYCRETKRVSDILVIENVPEYQSATASAELGPHWSLESVGIGSETLRSSSISSTEIHPCLRQEEGEACRGCVFG